MKLKLRVTTERRMGVKVYNLWGPTRLIEGWLTLLQLEQILQARVMLNLISKKEKETLMSEARVE